MLVEYEFMYKLFLEDLGLLVFELYMLYE